MINATNEAWFQDSSAPRQFLAISVFRAAENRVAVLRVANTGISAAIDPYGRIVRRLRGPEDRDVFIAGVLVAPMPVSRVTTFYTAFGDVFAITLVAGCGLLVIGVAIRAMARWARRASRAHERAIPADNLPVA